MVNKENFVWRGVDLAEVAPGTEIPECCLLRSRTVITITCITIASEKYLKGRGFSANNIGEVFV